MALRVLDRDPPLALLDEDDGDDHADRQQREEQLRGRAAVDPRPDRERRAVDDRREDDQRDAVSDPALRDLLAEPHQERRTGGEGDEDQHEPAEVRVQDALPPEQVGVAERLRGGEHDRQVPRVLVDLRVTGLALLLELGDRRDDHRHQLEDDRGGDVRHDPEREDREARERVAGEEVQQAEDRAALAAEVVRDLARVDARGRDEAAEPVERQDDGGEEEAAPELRHPPGVREPADSTTGFCAPRRSARSPVTRTAPRSLRPPPRMPLRRVLSSARLGQRRAPALRCLLRLLLVRRLQPGDRAAGGLDLLDRALRERVRRDRRASLRGRPGRGS